MSAAVVDVDRVEVEFLGGEFKGADPCLAVCRELLRRRGVPLAIVVEPDAGFAEGVFMDSPVLEEGFGVDWDVKAFDDGAK